MKTYIKNTVLAAFAALAIVGVGTVFTQGTSVGAVDPFGACGGSSDATVCNAKDDNLMKLMNNIINTLLFLVGIIAVVVIIVNGIRFVTSNGNQDQVTSARNGIIYAVVGIVVAVMAYAIVRFILGRIA